MSGSQNAAGGRADQNICGLISRSGGPGIADLLFYLSVAERDIVQFGLTVKDSTGVLLAQTAKGNDDEFSLCWF